MASIILRSVGSAVGNALLPGIGGAFLGNLGRSIGGLIDGQLGLGGTYQGPRLENLGVQDSRYGAGIPIIYGRARVAGNVIWSSDLIETSHNSSFSGGKGGIFSSGSATSTTYSYSAHCAVGIAQGPIGGIGTIWADSKVIYQNGVWASGILDSATIYTGTATQGPDAFMESLLGSGNVPGYRGLAYIVFENLQLSNFGNRLPNLTFEILPIPATAVPEILGSVNANISQRTQTPQSGGMLPIVLEGGAAVRRVLAGGYKVTGSNCVFEVVEYDVTDTIPVELARTSSTSFTSGDVADSSWALAPDGRTVAFYLENGTPLLHTLALYDIETRQFGTPLAASMASSTGLRQTAWIDAQHIVIDDASGTSRGVRVFARAGLGLVDLGFFDVWGAGSVSTRKLLGYAQFTAFAGGLLAYMTDVSGSYFSALYARPLAWRNNALAVGAAYTLASGLTPGTGSGGHANLIRTGDAEWTLCFGTVADYHLMSFEPGLSSGTVTRSWQSFSPGFGVGTTNFPVFYGDRLVVIHRSAFENIYRLSEVTLDSGGFTVALSAVAATGLAKVSAFGAMRLDSARFLLLGSGGFTYNLGEFAIVKRGDTGDSIQNILTDILTRAGYDSVDYDVASLGDVSVDGYVLPEPTTGRAAIEPLQVFQPFDLIESGDELVAVPRSGAADVTIPAAEWRAAPERKDQPPALDTIRAQELDLPLEVNIDYIDAGRDFEINSQRARRIVTRAKAVQKIALPIVCASNIAKRMAETRLYAAWAERELVRVRISRRWLALDPGDIVDLDDGRLLRVTAINQVGGLMELEGFFVNEATQSSAAAADAGQGADHPALAPLDSILYLMDLPLLQAADDQPGFYAAATGLPGWNGASLWRASDGVNYSAVASLPAAAISGMAVTALANAPCDYMDRAHSVQVQIVQGSLSSCSESDLYNGANAALLGGEIIQFQTATLTGPGLYTLSNLLRGRRGSEWAASTHAVGEDFVILTPGAVNFVPALSTDRGRSYAFRALTKGQTLGDAQDSAFTYQLRTLQPFAPAHLAGVRASGTGSDLTLSWKRRARISADWVDYVDVPLDEPEELYDVEIMNGGSVMRSFLSLTSPTAAYSAANQSSDWGVVPSNFTVRVYQISARYGRGRAAEAVV
ncbi:MAG: phage tail protein [Alphaproteobacteria bacterium]|nr:phage tail protein [Alphaproteobacteria bacterium]